MFFINPKILQDYHLETGHISPNDFRTLISWLKNDSDRILWSGKTFEMGLSTSIFLQHQKRKDLWAFSLRNKHNDLCGYAELVKRTNLQFNLCRVIVKPTLRRRGLGKFLCREVMRYAKKQMGCARMILNTLENNSSARSCYRSLGFETLEVKSNSRKFEDQWGKLIIMGIILPSQSERKN